jgi:hypothetical protein
MVKIKKKNQLVITTIINLSHLHHKAIIESIHSKNLLWLVQLFITQVIVEKLSSAATPRNQREFNPCNYI